MLSRKTPMKRTAFKRKTKPKKRRTLEQKTAAQLMKPADEAFSRYIRLRDSERVGTEFVGECITCPKRLTVLYRDDSGTWRWVASSQNGHFVGRGVYSLRYDELNCNLQCAHCNAWLEKNEMLARYQGALDDKYGHGTFKNLLSLSKKPEAYRRPNKTELLEIIAESKKQVELLMEIK